MKKFSLHISAPALIYGFHPTPFGECVIAVTDKKICYLAFLHNRSRAHAVGDVEKNWPMAELVHKELVTAPFAKKVFAAHDQKIPVVFQGTPFQIKVWKALQAIPRGKTVSYKDIAEKIGAPKAVRAVGTACGANHIAVVVPCHRVLASDGGMGGYRWGIARKKALLGWEAK